jgi:hypothetical protein
MAIRHELDENGCEQKRVEIVGSMEGDVEWNSGARSFEPLLDNLKVSREELV